MLEQVSKLQLLCQISLVSGKHTVSGHGTAAAFRRLQHFRPAWNGSTDFTGDFVVQLTDAVDTHIIVHVCHAGNRGNIEHVGHKRVIAHNRNLFRNGDAVFLQRADQSLSH